jgi:hypothetical protein
MKGQPMNIFPTLSQAIQQAIHDCRTGFMSDSRKTVYRNNAGEFVLVGDPAFASGPIVATVYKGRVYQDGIGGSPKHELSC